MRILTAAALTALLAACAQGAEWDLVYEDDFEREEVGEVYRPSRAELSIEDGALLIEGGGASCIIEKPFAPDVRLEFDTWSKPDRPACDLSAVMAVNPLGGYSYLLAFGGRSNQAHQLIGHNVGHVIDNPSRVIEHGQRYHMVATKEGKTLTYEVDGEVLLQDTDPDVLGGPGFDRIGFITWAGMYVDNVKVYERSEKHPDTPEFLAELPPLPFRREGRKLVAAEPADDPQVEAGLAAFDAARMDDALAAFERASDPLTRLAGMAYTMGDLAFNESTRDFPRLYREWQEAAAAHPDNETLQSHALAAKYFTSLDMVHRDGKTDALRLEGVGPENNPYYYKAILYKARYSFWDGAEGGNREVQRRAVDFMRPLLAMWPEHSVIRQYTGERIPWDEHLNADTENHPEWAAYLREAYARQVRIMEEWFTKRQQPDGQLGGGWGDDVELLRTWTQVAAISSGGKVAQDGIEKMAEGVWRILTDGYSGGCGDVEHQAEPGADTMPTMIFMLYGDPQYVEWNMRSCKTIRDKFMGIDGRGHPRFMSTEFGTRRVNRNQRAGGDTGYHARAMKHFIWLGWWGNPEARDWFVRWADGWRDVTMSEIRGKIAGVPPSTIWYPSGDIQPTEDIPWYDSNWNYYGSSGLGGMVFDSFLTALSLSGERRFAEAFNKGMELASVGPLFSGNFETGSLEWQMACMAHMPSGQKTATYRRLTGERAHDEYTLKHCDPAQKYEVDHDLAAFTSRFKKTAEGLRTNLEMMTTEVLATDRMAIPSALTTFGAYTGAVSGLRDAATPTFAVTYDSPDTDFAALVADTTPTRLRVWLYSFHDKPVTIRLLPWTLTLGRYVMIQGQPMPGERDVQLRYTWGDPKRVLILHRAEPVAVEVPPETEWVVDLRLIEAVKPPDAVPDLAIARRDVSVQGDTVAFTVHNIGTAYAMDTTAELQVPKATGWETIASISCGEIPRPADLEPSVRGCAIKAAAGQLEDGFRVVLDAADRVYEICETNNVVEVR